MRGGKYANISGNELHELRERHGLTQAQLAVLARSSVYKQTKGPRVARRIQAWESEESRIPLASYELLCFKLKLLEKGLTTYEELAAMPLVSIVFPDDKEFTKSGHIATSI